MSVGVVMMAVMIFIEMIGVAGLLALLGVVRVIEAMLGVVIVGVVVHWLHSTHPPSVCAALLLSGQFDTSQPRIH